MLEVAHRFKLGVCNPYENNKYSYTSCLNAHDKVRRRMARDPEAQAPTSRSYGPGHHNYVRRGG